jgi:hypothetical protein
MHKTLFINFFLILSIFTLLATHSVHASNASELIKYKREISTTDKIKQREIKDKYNKLERQIKNKYNKMTAEPKTNFTTARSKLYSGELSSATKMEKAEYVVKINHELSDAIFEIDLKKWSELDQFEQKKQIELNNLMTESDQLLIKKGEALGLASDKSKGLFGQQLFNEIANEEKIRLWKIENMKEDFKIKMDENKEMHEVEKRNPFKSLGMMMMSLSVEEQQEVLSQDAGPSMQDVSAKYKKIKRDLDKKRQVEEKKLKAMQ